MHKGFSIVNYYLILPYSAQINFTVMKNSSKSSLISNLEDLSQLQSGYKDEHMIQVPLDLGIFSLSLLFTILFSIY